MNRKLISSPAVYREMFKEAVVLYVAISFLDAKGVKLVRKRVREMIPATARVIIDVSAVAFLDSAGLDAVWEWIVEARTRGSSLCLSGPGKSVQALLCLARIPGAVPIFQTTAEALESFAQVAPDMQAAS